MPYTTNEITDNVLKWTRFNMPKDYEFRQYQLETIVNTIERVLNNEYSMSVVEAPTGSGKSLICLISAGVLADVYHKNSYILVSDLFLWSQYDDAIARYHLPFGRLKGTMGNYTCDKNGKDYRMAVCRIKKAAITKLADTEYASSHGWECANSCEYVQARHYAQKAKVTLMTYQLWLGQMCNAKNNEGQPNISFGERDVVFCDECHNIPDIVQNWATPSFSKQITHALLSKIYSVFLSKEFDMRYKTVEDFVSAINDLYDRMCSSEDKIELLSLLKEYYDIISSDVGYWLDKIMKIIARNDIKESDYSFVQKSQEAESLVDFLGTYINAIEATSPDYLIKQVTLSAKGYNELKFQCAKEDYLVYSYMLTHSHNFVTLSATVGDIDSFKDSIGFNHIYKDNAMDFQFTRIPSTFDFRYSPIIFSRDFNMTFKHIDDTMPYMAQAVCNIVNSPNFQNLRGIIHTGSYANTKKLFNYLTPEVRSRIIYYTDSKDKASALNDFTNSTNKILIGPTLVEGIDLKDDLCRFLIIIKVPFPQLKDKLVEAKKQLYPLWYKSTTNNSIIQAIGRGNRHPSDWCWSFVLDQSFYGLFTEQLYKPTSQYPKDYLDRLYEYKNGQFIKLF